MKIEREIFFLFNIFDEKKENFNIIKCNDCRICKLILFFY